MQRAAEISPLVHGRTIGPDVVLLDCDCKEHEGEILDDFSDLHNNEEKMSKNEINKRKTTPSKGQQPQISKSPIIDKLIREPNSLYVSKYIADIKHLLKIYICTAFIS